MALYSTEEELRHLPVRVEKEVAEHLVCYDEVTVTREYGKYRVTNCSCIKREYAPDHKVWFFQKQEVLKNTFCREIIEKGEKEHEMWCNTHEVNWEVLNN